MTNLFEDGFDLELLLATGYGTIAEFERKKHDNTFYAGTVKATVKVRV